jgi:hypothetical protein
MKKIPYLFCLFLISLVVYPQSSLTKISINPNSQKKGDLTLSSLVESVEYVPLETGDNILVGVISMFDISENYILVKCRNTGIIYLFQRNGRFVSKIGNIGGGPGEYVEYDVSAIFIEEDKKQVIVLVKYPAPRFLRYSLSGKFVDTEPVEDKAGAWLFIKLFDNHFFKMFIGNHPDCPYVYEVRTRDFRLVKEAVKTVPVERRGGWMTVSAPSRPYVFNGQVHVRESSLNDTLYAIDGKDFSFKPKYLIDAGRYKMSLEMRSNPDEFNKRLSEYVQCNMVFETKTSLLLTYLYGENGNGNLMSHYAYYEKNTGKLLYFSSQTGIPNDYDGGIDMWPQRQDNHICYAFYDAYLFSEKSSGQKKPAPKGTDQAVQSFDNFHRKLNPDDNPVLVIMKMKQ